MREVVRARSYAIRSSGLRSEQYHNEIMGRGGRRDLGCTVKTEPNRTKVLVVDDDETVLDATSYILTRAGYDVEATSEGLGLPLKVGKFRPHIILLDVDLPAIDGPRIALTLKGLRSAEECVIIFHSAEPEERLEQAVIDTGAAGYIPKGLRRDEFLSRLRRYTGAK